MRSELLAVSNNPLVWSLAREQVLPCRRISGTALDVLYACMDLVGEGGCALYAHALAGNARLVHNPFRSVAIAQAGQFRAERQAADLRQLEYFIRKLEELDGQPPEETFADYRIVDFELFRSIRPLYE